MFCQCRNAGNLRRSCVSVRMFPALPCAGKKRKHRRMIPPRLLSLLGVFLVGSVLAADRRTEPAASVVGQSARCARATPRKIRPRSRPTGRRRSGASGAAFIVCPGGGYRNLAAHEGEPYAKWLAAQGIAAFVLKYRLTTDGYHVPTALLDGARAIRHRAGACGGMGNRSPAHRHDRLERGRTSHGHAHHPIRRGPGRRCGPPSSA